MAQYDPLVVKSGNPAVLGSDTLRIDSSAAAGLTTTNLAAGDAVQITANNTLGKATPSSTSPIVGIYDGVTGATVKEGIVAATFKAGVTPVAGQPVYLSDEAGQLTTIKPTSEVVHEVGVVVDGSAKTILLGPKAVVALPSAKVLIAGGANDKTELFNIPADSTVALADMPYSPGQWVSPLFRLAGGKYFECGGLPGPTDKGVYFNGSVWVEAANTMQAPRVYFAAGMCGTGRVAIVDGSVDVAGNWNHTTDIYDPDTNLFVVGTVSPFNRRRFSAASLPYGLMAGKVVFVGGHDGFGTRQAGVNVFTDNGGAGTWQALPDLLTAVAHAAVVQISDGRIVVIGGDGVDGKKTQIYTPGNPNWWAGSWAYSGSLGTARGGAVMAGLRFGVDKIMVVGGVDTALVEVWDITTELWTYTANNLAHSLEAEGQMVELDDGLVVVNNGTFIGDQRLNIYDPATNSFTYSANQTVARSGARMCRW